MNTRPPQQFASSQDGGLRKETTVRAILLNEGNQVLLQRIEIPGRPPFFITPGGRVEASDTDLSAALLREIEEETGLSKQLIKVVASQKARVGQLRMLRDGQLVEMTEYFFVARLSGPDAIHEARQSLTDEEKRVLKSQRWLSLNEVENGNYIVLPVNLAQLVRAALRCEQLPPIDFSDPKAFGTAGS